MALKLLGKGSILDAIGGGLKTAANAGIDAVKDVGDVADVGFNTITGNQGGVTNAENAIASNNPEGQSLATNLGGLSSDVGATQAARAFLAPGIGLGTDIGNAVEGTNMTPEEATQNNKPLHAITEFATDNGKQNVTSPRQLLGNTIETGVNIATLGKGKALTEGVEALAPGVEKTAEGALEGSALAKAGGRVLGGTVVGGAYGAGQGAAQAEENAQNPKQAIEEIVKPAAENAVLGGGLGAVTAIPAVGRAAIDNAKPLDEVGGINNRPVPPPDEAATTPPPEPPPDIADEDLNQVHAGNPLAAAEPTSTPDEPLPPAPDDIAQSNNAAAELDQSMSNPSIDWTKVAGAGSELKQRTQEVADQLREQDKMVKKPGASELYGAIRQAGGIGKSDYEDIPLHLKKATGMSMDRVAQSLGYSDEDALHEAIENERDTRSAAASTKPKPAAEYQAQAQQYIAEHPQEFDNVAARAKAEQDVNDYQKADKKSGYSKAQFQVPKGAPAKRFIQALYDKTHSPEFQARNVVGRSLEDVRNTMQGVKALRDRAANEYKALTRKGTNASADDIRAKAAELRSQNTRLHVLQDLEQRHMLGYREASTALDARYPDTELTVPKKGVRLTSNRQQFETARPIPGETAETAPTPGKPSAAYSLEEALGHPLTAERYTGPNLNEGAFGPEDQALLDAKEAAQNEPPKSIAGDQALLDGIKAGDSDAAIVRSYMDATGSDSATAKKAFGVIEDDPNADKTGAVENNPYHGKLADYDVNVGPKRGIGKILLRPKAVGRQLINKALLKATATGDHLAYKLTDANHLWSQLAPEDRVLADQLRNHSIDEVAGKAKDPEAFRAYATRAKDIEDYVHAARGNADPYDVTPYRQNYGAGFHLQNDTGEPVSLEKALGQQGPHALARHYSTYDDLKAVTGLDRSTQDFHEDLTKDVVSAQYHTSTHSLYNGLKQAFGDDKVAYGTPTTTASVPLKEFPGVYADQDIADRINSRANYEYDNDAFGRLLRGGDKLNASMKSVKLSIGGFHNINEMLNQLALNPTGAGGAARALVDSDYFRARMNEWDQNGTMEKALHSGLTLGNSNEFKSGINRVPIIKQAHDALFGRQIPLSKMQVFERYTKGLDLNNAADYDKMRGIARGINNTFGGINRLVDGLNPTRLQQLSRGFLAVDYNEGQIRTLMSALYKGGTEGRMARQVVAGRAMILATPGVIQGIANGQIGNNPKDISKFVLNQLVNPTVQTGFKTPGGTPKQISLVAGIVNKADRTIAPALNKENPNKLSGVESELSGNLSPAASLTEEEKANSDYYGNPMHGKGQNALEDVGAALNAAAPIPFSPAGRALAGTHFKDNPVVKLISGGQSAISPTEAAIDTSGIGRVSANPTAPAMQIMNSRELLAEGLSSDDKAALEQVHPGWDGKLSKAQQNAIYANPDYEIDKWNVLRQNSNIYSVLQKQNAVAEKNGEPGDPLLALSKKDYNTVTEYEFLKHSDEGTDASNTAAVMYSENKAMIDKYETNNSAYETQMTALYNKTSGTKGDNEPVEAVGGAPQYTETPQQTQLSNQYFAMTDANSTSQQRAQFLTDNPELNQLFNAQFAAENAIRKQQGEPLLKPYPEPSGTLNTFMNSYTAASKTERTSMRTANPSLYNQMSNYMGQVDQYELAKTLGQTQFQGQNPTQEQLKEEYDLGQYDVAQNAGADGNDTYVLDPQEAYDNSTGYNPATGTYSGSGSDSGASKLIQELENEDKARDVKNTVKYDYKPIHLKIKHGGRINLKRPKLSNTGRQPKISLKAKSVAIK